MERQARKPLFLSPTLNYTSVRKEKKGELFLLKKTKKKKKIEAATFMVSLFNHLILPVHIYIYNKRRKRAKAYLKEVGPGPGLNTIPASFASL